MFWEATPHTAKPPYYPYGGGARGILSKTSHGQTTLLPLRRGVRAAFSAKRHTAKPPYYPYVGGEGGGWGLRFTPIRAQGCG